MIDRNHLDFKRTYLYPIVRRHQIIFFHSANPSALDNLPYMPLLISAINPIQKNHLNQSIFLAAEILSNIFQPAQIPSRNPTKSWFLYVLEETYCRLFLQHRQANLFSFRITRKNKLIKVPKNMKCKP